MGLTNDDVIARWVEHNEDQTYRRNMVGSGSITFNDRVLYSYRTPIARYNKGKQYVLFAVNRWGVTTQRHINTARRYVEYVNFVVPDVMDDDITGNHEYLLQQLLHRINYATKAFKHRESEGAGIPYYLRDPIVAAHHDYCKYVHLALDITEPGVDPLMKVIEQVTEAREKKWTAFNDPKAVEKRERAAARRMAQQALLGE